MKKYSLLFIAFLISANLFAQKGTANQKIHFAYDNAGNQIQRFFAGSKLQKQSEEVVESAVENIEEKQENISLLEYYPNPVENNLTITWAKSINTNVTSVFVFNMSGKLVKNFSPSQKSQELNLPFHDVATGVYIINVTFNNGKEDAFKILKK